MTRCTTPTLVLKIPSTVPVLNVNDCTISFMQYDELLIKFKKSDVTIDQAKNAFVVTLTQAQTDLFRAGVNVKIQVKMRVNHTIFTTKIVERKINYILDDEVME